MGATRLVRRSAAVLRVTVMLAALVGASGGRVVHAQGADSDAAAKAKFTVTLARFVQWPPGALAADGTPLRLCVFHNSPTVGAAFARHAGELVAGRPLRIVPNPGAADAECELLFVDASAARAGADAVARAGGTPALTLGAVDGFLSQGGMVELANVNDTLRFDVSLKAMRAMRLGLSSQVLMLARQVRQ